MRKYNKLYNTGCKIFCLLAGIVVFTFRLAAQDTTAVTASDTVPAFKYNKIIKAGAMKVNSNVAQYFADTAAIRFVPYISVQQMVKGNLAGVYVQEPSGEPGTDQNIFVQGINGPLLRKKDLYDQQATVYLNGIPLNREHPFIYEIQKSDAVRIGTATNALAILGTNNIESIEVIKDPAKLALLGPLAANGAIWITTKNAKQGEKQISINLHSGYTPVPDIEPVNAAYEMKFRRPFYTAYGPADALLSAPAFLRDSTNSDYYGPANWYKSYYKPVYTMGADASLTGGFERANFRFFLSGLKDANTADKTALQRYNTAFYINVTPIEWLKVSSMLAYNRTDRIRNRSAFERFSEERYIPDLTNPLTPNSRLYDQHLDEFRKAKDKNTNNSLQAYFNVNLDFKRLQIQSRIGLDNEESYRDAFWPTTLLEGNNFSSYYVGVMQRMVIANSATYNYDFNDKKSISLKAFQNYTRDMQRYSYAYGYNSPNDFIKSLAVDGPTDFSSDYTAYYYPAKIQSGIASFGGVIDFNANGYLNANVIVRRDGSSAMQPSHKWYNSYAGNIEYDLSKHLGIDNYGIRINAAYGHMGKTINDDRFSMGPVYVSGLGWQAEPTLGTYAGFPGLIRPYNSGWVNYDYAWAYYNKASLGLTLSLFKDRLNLSADVYNRNDKNGIFLVPVAKEWGYVGEYQSGLEVNNRGIDLTLNANIIEKKGLQWRINANIAFNNNELKALPGGLDEIVIGDNKLKVGERVDAFWVYETENGSPVGKNFQGIQMQNGDPNWKDQNGDGIINSQDKVFKGNYMPKQFGGVGTAVQYKGFDIDLQFYFALNRTILNRYAATRLDFINTDNIKSYNSIKEITYWERKQDLEEYPVYNPWSTVIPYRTDQDLFLDNGAYVKLRSATLSYDLARLRSFRRLSSMKLYVTGTNLYTLTRFKADDPELTDYQGNYNGRGLPLPRSVIVGLKLNF